MWQLYLYFLCNIYLEVLSSWRISCFLGSFVWRALWYFELSRKAFSLSLRTHKHPCHSVCPLFPVFSCVRYVPSPEDEELLETCMGIYLDFEQYAHALRLALMKPNRVAAESSAHKIFTACTDRWVWLITRCCEQPLSLLLFFVVRAVLPSVWCATIQFPGFVCTCWYLLGLVPFFLTVGSLLAVIFLRVWLTCFFRLCILCVVCCSVIQKQLAFMAGRQQIYLDLEDDIDGSEDLSEIMANVHLNTHFLALAREVRIFCYWLLSLQDACLFTCCVWLLPLTRSS